MFFLADENMQRDGYHHFPIFNSQKKKKPDWRILCFYLGERSTLGRQNHYIFQQFDSGLIKYEKEIKKKYKEVVSKTSIISFNCALSSFLWLLDFIC